MTMMVEIGGDAWYGGDVIGWCSVEVFGGYNGCTTIIWGTGGVVV